MEKQKKDKAKLTPKSGLVIALLLALLICILSIFVDVRVKIGGGGECISIAFFEKQKLAGVDKIVIKDCWDDKEITITDTEVVKKVVKETAIATLADLQHGSSKYIYMYDGDMLVRIMSMANSQVKVYEEDALHWIFQDGALGRKNYGFVELSPELYDTLVSLWYEKYPNG